MDSHGINQYLHVSVLGVTKKGIRSLRYFFDNYSFQTEYIFSSASKLGAAGKRYYLDLSHPCSVHMPPLVASASLVFWGPNTHDTTGSVSTTLHTLSLCIIMVSVQRRICVIIIGTTLRYSPQRRRGSRTSPGARIHVLSVTA